MTGLDDDGSATDPRSVANLILKTAGRPLSNLELQKLLYFAHAAYIMRNKKALVSGYFEAWTYGPVHPAVYSSFKSSGSEPITTLAQKKDIRTGEITEIDVPTDPEIVSVVRKTVHSLGDMTPGQLVKLSHAKDGAWDVVYARSKNERMLGLRISNELIRERYRNHWLSADKLNHVEEPSEDTPLTYHRFG
ncbi:type VI toxin-antitoxin system SocA family antitoxin [Sphingomonas sp. PB4P5]|uniref:type VI toxin-antitoxin system SocA family antitoxin n=1 Tax=Parasphingomonas puruogangriensis TaxID=3096155 RepID=UPI003FA68382